MPVIRIYVMCRGQRTTISVDDQLMGYLERRLSQGKTPRLLAASHPDLGQGAFERRIERDQKAKATKAGRLWIQDVVDAAGDLLPQRGVSQWVQARIVDVIANPALKDDVTRARDTELAARVQALDDLRTAQWREHDAKCKAYEKKKELLQQMVRGRLGDPPRYRRPPRTASL